MNCKPNFTEICAQKVFLYRFWTLCGATNKSQEIEMNEKVGQTATHGTHGPRNLCDSDKRAHAWAGMGWAGRGLGPICGGPFKTVCHRVTHAWAVRVLRVCWVQYAAGLRLPPHAQNKHHVDYIIPEHKHRIVVT